MKVCTFDLEIAENIPEGFAWEHGLDISCAATALQDGESRFWADPNNPPGGFDFAFAMGPAAIAELVDYLWDLQAVQKIPIVTWNGLSFDFRALAFSAGGNRDVEQKIGMLAMNHIDLMFLIRVQKGFPISLQSAADGLKVAGKTEGMHGDLAPDMWKFSPEDQRKVLEYVIQDAEATLRVYRALKAQGQLTWTTKSGSLSRYPWFPAWTVGEEVVPPESFKVPGDAWDKAFADAGRRFPNVKECLDRVPKADTSWMDRAPPSLETYYSWTTGMVNAALRPVMKHKPPTEIPLDPPPVPEDEPDYGTEYAQGNKPSWEQTEWDW